MKQQETNCGRIFCKNKDCDTCFEIANKIWWEKWRGEKEIVFIHNHY